MFGFVFRFNKTAVVDLNLDDSYSNMTLGEYLHQQGYSQIFVDKYLVPMGSAIWSATSSAIKDFPLKFFVRFFHNHGLLSVSKRPQWHVLKDGSKSYIEPLIAPFKDNIRLNTPVDQIHRYDDRVEIKTASGNKEIFDQVIIATHSDQALGLLVDASEIEQRVLKAIPYQDNEVVLHTDTSLLPSNRKTWSSWNYRIMQEEHKQAPPVLTYNMNILQSIDAQSTFCVTLNKTEAIDPEKIIGVYHYAHPVFSADAVAAQEQWKTVNGVNRTWCCGAYWGNGFHEDGLNSALRIAEKFGFSSSDNHFSSCR
jgi:predicted NAD/FAD-binding protein